MSCCSSPPAHPDDPNTATPLRCLHTPHTHTHNTDQRAFVITLTRAGEDDKSFKLTDIDSTFAGFQGADYDLQVRGWWCGLLCCVLLCCVSWC